jgi:serine/threonine protein kinase
VDLEQPTNPGLNDQEPVGEVLAGEYEILQFLGSGGMSRVYKAHHRSMDRHVAVKILHQHLLDDARKMERFRTEAKTTSALHHQNIVDVYSFVEDLGKPFLVMDYIEGESLQQRIKATGKLSAAAAVSIFRQASSALEHAHLQGIIHRDVKPSNIMLCSGPHPDTVKLLDFGIAKLLPRFQPEAQSLTQTDALLGSPLYMSPEQCSNHTVDERSDIYSLGCVMYEALSGKPPFAGDSALAIMYGHLHEMPEAMDSSSVPANLQAVVLKALQKEPEKRYQSMTELRADLKSIDEDSQHILPAVASAGRRNTRRKARPLVLAAIAVLPVVAMGMFIAGHSDQFKEPALEAQLYANSLFKGDPVERIKLLHERGLRQADTEDFANALKSFEEAGRLADAGQHWELSAAAKVQRSLIEYKTASTNQSVVLNKARNEYDQATDIYLNLARAALDQHRFAEMDRLLKEVVRLDNERPMNNLAYIHASKVPILRSKMAARQGKFDEAEQWARKAVEYCESKERGSLHQADALIRLATILLKEEKTDEGERVLNKARVILASLTPPEYRQPNQKINPAIRSYRTTDLAFAPEMHNLGSTLLDAACEMFAYGNYKNSLELALQARKILRASPTPTLHLATCNAHLAVHYANQRKFEQSEQQYLEAIKVCDRLGPVADEFKTQCKYGLANVLRQDSKMDEARKYLDEIISAREKDIAMHTKETAASEAIMACLMEKAVTYADPQSPAREACFRQIVSQYKEGAPLSQTQAGLLAQAHFFIADIASAKSSNWDLAEADLIKSEQFWAKAAGPNPASGATYDYLSRMEKKRGHTAKAREYLHKALDVYKATVGTNDPSYKSCKDALEKLQAN